MLLFWYIGRLVRRCREPRTQHLHNHALQNRHAVATLMHTVVAALKVVQA